MTAVEIQIQAATISNDTSQPGRSAEKLLVSSEKTLEVPRTTWVHPCDELSLTNSQTVVAFQLLRLRGLPSEIEPQHQRVRPRCGVLERGIIRLVPNRRARRGYRSVQVPDLLKGARNLIGTTPERLGATRDKSDPFKFPPHRAQSAEMRGLERGPLQGSKGYFYGAGRSLPFRLPKGARHPKKSQTLSRGGKRLLSAA
jgi:hypothetical protein